jgi:hypothetical protein
VWDLAIAAAAAAAAATTAAAVAVAAAAAAAARSQAHVFGEVLRNVTADTAPAAVLYFPAAPTCLEVAVCCNVVRCYGRGVPQV